MQYTLIGEGMPALEVTLNANESMYTQRGGMAWMSDGITMDSNMRGDLMKGIGRAFSGETMFMATYTAQWDGAKVAFASTVQGEIYPHNVSQSPLICQKGAFLCAEPNVQTSVQFTRKFSAGLFGGEGFILQRAEGAGMLFLEVDGAVVEKVLAPGEVLRVDTGNVVAFEPSVSYEIETVKGLKNIFLGGEGLFLTRLTGPGKVILQTMNFNELCGKIGSRIAVRS